MNIARTCKAATTCLLFSGTVMAEEVTLPAPVLEWSVYILLVFTICVAIGISIFKNSRSSTTRTLKTLLHDENPMIHAVDPATSVTECVKRMNDLRIGAMMVMQGDRLVGIFTERDAITRVLGAGLDPATTSISDVMTANPVCVSPSTSFEEAMNIVSSRRIRHLPVVENDKVKGMVSSGDLTHRMSDI